MTLQTSDIGALFAAMRASYGHLWPHGADEIPVWQNALGGYTASQVMDAANAAVREHRNGPPSIGQMMDICRRLHKPRPSTYLPAPKMDTRKVNANRKLIGVLVRHGPVSDFTLRNMVGLKNAIADEWNEPVTEADREDLEQQLLALIEDGRRVA